MPSRKLVKVGAGRPADEELSAGSGAEGQQPVIPSRREQPNLASGRKTTKILMKTRSVWKVLGFLSVAFSTVMFVRCAGLGTRLEPPRVTLADMKIEEIKALEAITKVELRVVNTNDVSLEIEGVDCTIQLNNRAFGTGVLNTKTTVPPRDTALLPMTIYSSLIEVGRGIFESRADSKFTYKIKGRLHLGGGLPSFLPFSSEGELSL